MACRTGLPYVLLLLVHCLLFLDQTEDNCQVKRGRIVWLILREDSFTTILHQVLSVAINIQRHNVLA
jgi:hypothetical protein